ncbi:MAG: metalloregulator ArsR/SmtB family transcription factor [Anaerolineae bacterium]|nr:metalloregulator ArsR/SmtB family transcription factor [Anaerolineae bacterium]
MPLQVFEETDAITHLISFRTSAVFETIVSLQNLISTRRHRDWAEATRAALPDDLLEELDAIYPPLGDGTMLFELALDYADHDDVPGFIQHVRAMDPATFVYYVMGRIVSQAQIAQIGLDAPSLREALNAATPDEHHPAYECLPIEQFIEPGFQARVADLWQRYWDSFFSAQIDDMRRHWEHGIAAREPILVREGGQALIEHVTGKSGALPELPEGHPVAEVVFIPLYLIRNRVLMYYGYGNVTVLFDSQRTESHAAEIEKAKEEALGTLRALGDGTRLKILRLIAHKEGKIHGKMIAAHLELSASAVSRHLALLKEGGLIVEEPEDNRITYRLQKEAITTLPDKVLDFLYS